MNDSKMAERSKTEIKSAERRRLEHERLLRMSECERPFREMGFIVAGMDEAGRGPLAGPVVAGCVVMPTGCLIDGVNDSKKLTEKKRERLYAEITEKAAAYGTGWVWPDTIDEINILQATKLAFKLAFERTAERLGSDWLGDGRTLHVFVDAVTGLDIRAEQHAVIYGDALCYSIAAASIIAKVERDRYMADIAEKYPAYGFERNKGYGTREHIEALRSAGPCEIHRRTFIKNFVR